LNPQHQHGGLVAKQRKTIFADFMLPPA